MNGYECIGTVVKVRENGKAVLDTGETLGPLFLEDPEVDERVYWRQDEWFDHHVFSMHPCKSCETDLLMGDEDFICPNCNRTYPSPNHESPYYTEEDKDYKLKVAEFIDSLVKG